MQYLDKVKVIADRPKYAKFGVHKGMVGDIIFPEIRYNTFEVTFNELPVGCEEVDIDVADLELVKSYGLTDAEILEDLPKQDPRWWCKVENGYILNLKGERKNKIPYDYNS